MFSLIDIANDDFGAEAGKFWGPWFGAQRAHMGMLADRFNQLGLTHMVDQIRAAQARQKRFVERRANAGSRFDQALLDHMW